MKFIAIVLALSVSSLALSAIRVVTKIELKGGVNLSPVVVVQDGQWAVVTQEDVTLKLNAKSNKDSVQIKAEILQGKILQASPSVVTKWGGPATLSVTEDDGTLKYRITFTPTKE